MRRVVITGMGMVSPLAHNLQQSWKSLLLNNSGILRYDNDPILKNKKPLNLSLIKDFNYKQHPVPHATSRQNTFIISATNEALTNSQLTIQQQNKQKIGICLGIISSNITKIYQYVGQSSLHHFQNINRLSLLHLITSIPTGVLNVKYRINGPSLTVNTACASGLSAVIQATKYIKDNDADIMIAGGVQDSYNPIQINSCLRIQAMTSKQYQKPQQASRPFDKKRSGFVLGQGCGILILQQLQHAKKRKATILGQILGFGQSSDGHHLVKPLENGIGQIRAMQLAITRSNVKKQDIAFVDCHATSTPAGDQIQANSIKTVFSNLTPYLTASKSSLGHTLGAAGALQLIFAIQSMNNSLLPKIQNLQNPDIQGLNYVREKNISIDIPYFIKNSFGFGGVNVSVVVGKFKA